MGFRRVGTNLKRRNPVACGGHPWGRDRNKTGEHVSDGDVVLPDANISGDGGDAMLEPIS